MAGGMEPAGPRGRGRWAALAAVVLSCVGFVLVAIGVLVLVQGIALQAPASSGLAGLVAGIGLAIVVVGLLHVIAGVYAMAQRAWARSLGVAFGVMGVGLGLVALWQDMHELRRGSMQSIGLLAIPYMVVLVGLIVGGDHFRRGSPSDARP